jgi:hypothetical protein
MRIKLFYYILFNIAFTSLTFSQVGIGTTTPTETLDVNGRIVAKGFQYTLYEAGGINAGLAQIIGDNTWRDFPDLSITFTIDEPTTVLCNYNFAFAGSGNGYIVTRLLIDNVEVNRTLTTNGSLVYLNNSDDHFAELVAGTHTIKVQYRSTVFSNNFNPSANDYMNRFMLFI